MSNATNSDASFNLTLSEATAMTDVSTGGAPTTSGTTWVAATAVLPATTAVPIASGLMSTADAPMTTAVPDAGGAAIAKASAPMVAANVGHQVVHAAAPVGAGKSAAPADPPALTGSRWEAAGSFDQTGLRRMRSASPYGLAKPGRLQVRGDMTPRKTAAQEAVEHLSKENEEQRRVIQTQVEQVRHVSDVALKAKRDAELAEAAKKKAYEDAQQAQADGCVLGSSPGGYAPH